MLVETLVLPENLEETLGMETINKEDNMRRYSRNEWSRVFDDVVGERVSGGGDQGVYQQSATKKFPIGARKVFGGRVYRYGYTVNGLIASALMSKLGINSHYESGYGTSNLCFGNVHFVGGVPIPANSPYVDYCDVTARPVNYYQGGYLVVFSTLSPYTHQHNIIASELGNGTYVRLWLDEPTFAAIPLLNADGFTTDAAVYRSPYAAFEEAESVSSGFEPFVGVCLAGKVEPLRYIWILTAGPVWLQSTAAGGDNERPGATINYRTAYANPQGTVDPAGQVSTDHQQVGYVLYVSIATKDATMIMLQLDH